MYDTLSIAMPADRSPSVDLMAEIPAQLTKAKEILDLSTGTVTVTGHCKNFRVTVKETGIFMSGSLSKFYYGNNQSTLNLKDTKDAITTLSDALHLPLSEGLVRRLDFAGNYIISHPVASYFDALSNCPYYEKLSYNSSLYFESGRRTMLFYDKVAEQILKKEPIIKEFEGQNVLRYEYRLQNKIADQLKRDFVKVSDLYEPDFYREVLLRYHNEYKSIHKMNYLFFDPEIIGDVKALKNQLLIDGIEARGGEKVVLDMLEAAKKRGEFTNGMQYGRSRKMVRELCSKPILTGKSDFITELDFKINEKVQTELSSL